MARQKKTIITCAVTGAIHTPTMSDALPYTYDDIAREAIEAAEAGASILHLHARDNETGAPSVNPNDFAAFLPRVKQATDAVVNISTGGSLTLSIQDRIKPAATFSAEMCSMNMGSMNFSFHPLAKRYGDDDWKFDWEKEYVAGSDGNIFRNTFQDIEEAAKTLAPHDIKFEHECYDVGHLYNLKFCMDIGLFKAPIFIQFVMGILGGIGADIDNLVFMKQTADKLFGDDYRWSIPPRAHPKSQWRRRPARWVEMCGSALKTACSSAGELAKSNAQQVAKIRRIVEDSLVHCRNPRRAREILDLKGGDRVNF